ncbi:pentapeptide repeat-containing protein [Burkholderia cenocepacia]
MALDFSDADLAGADFRDAVFEGGSLRNAHLNDARFEVPTCATWTWAARPGCSRPRASGATVPTISAMLIENFGIRVA